MVIDVNATSTVLGYALPAGVTSTILFDDKKSDDKKSHVLLGSTLAVGASATIQSIAQQAVLATADEYVASLSDDELAYACELLEAKEKELNINGYIIEEESTKPLQEAISSQNTKTL